MVNLGEFAMESDSGGDRFDLAIGYCKTGGEIEAALGNEFRIGEFIR